MPGIKAFNSTQLEFDEVLELFSSSYPSQENNYTLEFFKWRYEKCFGKETSFVGLYDDKTLIGQAVIFQQSVQFENTTINVAQLADLVVHPNHRSIAAVRLIYKELKSILEAKDFDIAFTLPNEKSLKFNQRFLKLKTVKQLPARVSLGFPICSKEISFCETFKGGDISSSSLNNILNTSSSNSPLNCEIKWTEKTLTNRLLDPRHSFGIVSNRVSTMVTSPRYIRGIPCILIMGLFCKKNKLMNKAEWTALVNASSRLFKNPLHLYIGRNHKLENDFGFPLPDFLHSSKRPVQFLCNNESLGIQDFSKLELIDIDIY